MRKVILSTLTVIIAGCVNNPTQSLSTVAPECEGSVELPPHLATLFKPIEDTTLLDNALGEPNRGGLCQGQVYVSLEETPVQIYRAWNSTNPGSQFGNWWAFEKPAGAVADYREDYEICYQWSPLDRMVSCTLSPGTKVVVGNGQSAECSQYLTYPVSDKQQVYIEDSASAVIDCTDHIGVLTWEPAE